MNGSLHIIVGSGVQQVIPLQMGRYVIGRSQNAAIQIDSHQVSRKHAEVIVRNGKVQLIDCKSSNGTFLNGQKVRESHLQDGDRVSVGEVVLEYHAEEKTRDKSVLTRLADRPVTSASTHKKPRSLQRVLMLSFALPLVALVALSGLGYQNLMEEKLTEASLQQGQELVRYLAEKNRESLRLGNELLLDVDSVLREKGVREAYIVNAKGRTLAPITHLNQPMKDPFTTEAMARHSDRKILPSPPLADGSRVFVHPIRAYNDKMGMYETLGVAKIVFAPAEAMNSSQEGNRIFLLMLLGAVALALLFGWATLRLISSHLNKLAERLHRWRAGLGSTQEDSQFAELRPIYNAVNRTTEEKWR